MPAAMKKASHHQDEEINIRFAEKLEGRAVKVSLVLAAIAGALALFTSLLPK